MREDIFNKLEFLNRLLDMVKNGGECNPTLIKRLLREGLENQKSAIMGMPDEAIPQNMLRELEDLRGRIYIELAKKKPSVGSYAGALEKQNNSGEKSPKKFINIIQYSDKEALLKRLHELIDGKRGAEVGAVLMNAWFLNPYLTRRPTRTEFESEFELIGSVSAISNYMDDNNQNAVDKANKIVIFQQKLH